MTLILLLDVRVDEAKRSRGGDNVSVHTGKTKIKVWMWVDL